MTHDELLASIEKMMNHDAIFMKDALRAVVELHKPVKVNHNYYDTGLGCSAPSCHDKYDEPGPYPCETIEAIEKELA
jgi:hypothetical protein